MYVLYEVMGVTNPKQLECIIGEHKVHITINMQNVCIMKLSEGKYEYNCSSLI